MRTALFVAVLCCTAASAESQGAGGERSRWASGMSIGLPGLAGESGGEVAPQLFTVGGNFTQITPGVGADISVFTIPRIIPEGAVPLVARFGIGHAIPVGPNNYFTPSIGILGAGIVAANGGGATSGWYAGASFMSFGSTGAGLRLGCNLYGLSDTAAWHLEVGFVKKSGSGK